MIAKGKSRAEPAQLASYLLRVHTRDGDQRVEVLELQSGTDSLRETFLDWHSVGLGTRGEKTLYHAQISPAPGYAMTTEQWKRTADILGEELGLKDHDRVLVLHDKGEHPHLHVVWQRVDVETMTMWDDGHNYMKHERASRRMELEFGQDFVPGKHAKRDRKKQPEFPRAETNHAERQQEERTGISAADRKNKITALKQACDGAVAFKAALEEQGYILAKGNRGSVLVDEMGNVYSLARQIRGIKTAELREFMKAIEQALPTVEEAKETQKERLEQAEALASSEPPPDNKPPEPVPDAVQTPKD